MFVILETLLKTFDTIFDLSLNYNHKEIKFIFWQFMIIIKNTYIKSIYIDIITRIIPSDSKILAIFKF